LQLASFSVSITYGLSLQLASFSVSNSGIILVSILVRFIGGLASERLQQEVDQRLHCACKAGRVVHAPKALVAIAVWCIGVDPPGRPGCCRVCRLSDCMAPLLLKGDQVQL
jgi:hypothetical protein